MKIKLLFLLIIIGGFQLKSQTKDSSFVLRQILIKGNKKTKDFIIYRDLTFKAGDTITNWQKEKEQSRKQLLNLFLFNEVYIELVDQCAVITVLERWYIWPIPIVELADRNFNQWWLSKDLTRLIYGIELKWHNIGGLNHTLLLDAQTGYTRKININYKVPYINKKLTWGLQVNMGTSANRELWYRTINDKVAFFRDNDLVVVNRKNFELKATHRKRINNYHQPYIGYRYTRVSDTVLRDQVNSNFLLNKNTNYQNEYYIGYQFTHDKRDFRGFPLTGHYFKASVEGPYFLNQKNPIVNIKLQASKYHQIKKDWFLSIGSIVRYFNLPKIPYSNIQALGYNREIIRGYELNVIDGNHFILGKSEIKYRFLNKKYPLKYEFKGYKELPCYAFISSFYDIGYVKNKNPMAIIDNLLPNEWQYGYGIGLNVVFFYDYCVRLEYSNNKYDFNRMYLNFIAPI